MMGAALWFILVAILIEVTFSPIRDHVQRWRERKRIATLQRIPFPTPTRTPPIVIHGVELGAANYRSRTSPETLISVVTVDADYVWFMLDDTLIVATHAGFVIDYEPRQPTRISTQ